MELVIKKDGNAIVEASDEQFFNVHQDDAEKIAEIRDFLSRVLLMVDYQLESVTALGLAKKMHIEPDASISSLYDEWMRTLHDNGLSSKRSIVDLATQSFLSRCQNEVVDLVDLDTLSNNYWKTEAKYDL